MQQQIDFWLVHGWLFLIGLVFFPRLTMLIAGTVSKFGAFVQPWNILAWVAWIFVPHFLVAILATTFYWNTNPVLCVIAWVMAFTGTGGEAETVRRSRS